MIRTRFAPSPTGELHVGGLRTALFNYLLARRNGGTFILRIEDTDQSRLVPGAAGRILDHLQWAGLTPDEGEGVGGPFTPYTQSQRLELYQEAAHKLLSLGVAYRIKIKGEKRYAIKMEIPEDKRTPVTWEDAILGHMEGSLYMLKDTVLLKSDGFPTYHLASVVDDHIMRITHVLRGVEWVPSTPKHLLLYRWLGWQPPVFGHIPLILDGARKKLSKRSGAASVSIYRERGILPSALVNHLALLGWSSGGDRELFKLTELERVLSIKRIRRAASVFEPVKLGWFNKKHLQEAVDGHP